MAKGDFEKLHPPRLVALDPTLDEWADLGDPNLDLYPRKRAQDHAKATDGEIAEETNYVCKIEAVRLIKTPVRADLATWRLTRPMLVCEFSTLAERDSKGRPYHFWDLLWIDFEPLPWIAPADLNDLISGKTGRLSPDEVALIDFRKLVGKGALLGVSEGEYGTNRVFEVKPDPYAPTLLKDILRDECLTKQYAFGFAADFEQKPPKVRKRPKTKDADDDAINMAELNAEQRYCVWHQNRQNQITREIREMTGLQNRIYLDARRFADDLRESMASPGQKHPLDVAPDATSRFGPGEAMRRYRLSVFHNLRRAATLSHYRLRLRQGVGLGKPHASRPPVAVETLLPFPRGITDEEIREMIIVMQKRTALAGQAVEQAMQEFEAAGDDEQKAATSRAIYEAEIRLQAMQHDLNAAAWKLYLRETGTDTTAYYEA